jgi:site-specific DNA recombinase
VAQQGGEWCQEDVFRDEGYSGATLRRPGPDRLARNYVHQMVLLEELERCGCQVEFLDRPMNQDPHDQLLLQIRGAVAEYERTLIAERMRRGRLRKLQAGTLLPWTHPPYGYRLGLDRPRDPAAVRVEPREAAVVGEIFARYLDDNGSLASLAKGLSARGEPTPTGRAIWSTSTLRGILTNPAYAGQVYAGRVSAARPCIRWGTPPIRRP